MEYFEVIESKQKVTRAIMTFINACHETGQQGLISLGIAEAILEVIATDKTTLTALADKLESSIKKEVK